MYVEWNDRRVCAEWRRAPRRGPRAAADLVNRIRQRRNGSNSLAHTRPPWQQSARVDVTPRVVSPAMNFSWAVGGVRLRPLAIPRNYLRKLRHTANCKVRWSCRLPNSTRPTRITCCRLVSDMPTILTCWDGLKICNFAITSWRFSPIICYREIKEKLV